MKYRALVGLTVPVDADEDTRIRAATAAGAPIPHEERKTVRIEEGEVADYIPELSLPWLLEQSLIEPVPDESMTKVQLEEMASDRDVDLTGTRTKAEIVERLEEAAE